jgi:hypothetical protein
MPEKAGNPAFGVNVGWYAPCEQGGMRAGLALLFVGLATAATACAASSADDGAESGEDAFTSGVPVRVQHDFPPLDLELTKEVRDAFNERGYGVTSKLTPAIRFSLTRATLSGQVTPGRSEHGRPTILSAELAASAHYSASFEIALDVDGIGNVASLSGHDREDWEEKYLGGKPIVLAKNLLPMDIPVGGPLFVHTHIDVAVGCALNEINGHMGAKTGAGFEGDFGFSIGYRRDHFPENDQRFRFATVPPNFETHLTPLTFASSPTNVKGRCALQPSLVVLLERTIGAKLFVEPYVDLEATYSRDDGALDVGKFYGVQGHAETAVEAFGHTVLRPFEFPLFDRRFDGRSPQP